MSRRERRSRHELSASRIRLRVLPPCPDHFAPRQCASGLRTDFEAFEHVVVEHRLLRCRGDRFAQFRIPHHDVGIRSRQHRALLRIDVQDSGDVRGCRRDEFVRGQPSRFDAFRPEHRQPLLETARSVRNKGEVVPAHALLLRGECRVIRGDHLERPGRQSVPESVLMLARTEGRRHHAPRRVLPILREILAFVQS